MNQVPSQPSDLSPWSRKDILQKAQQCVMVDRNVTHGDPEDNFSIIAGYWNNYLASKGYIANGTIDAIDVAAMMILMKMSRLSTSPSHHDHWVDIAGYSACGGEIATKDKESQF